MTEEPNASESTTATTDSPSPDASSSTKAGKPKVAAKRPARQAPVITSGSTENAPKWASGLNLVITALISVMLVLGLENLGGGIGEILSSKADTARIESLTTAQMLQSMQSANITLQQRVLQLESDLRKLQQENQELRTVLKYEKGIVLTAVPTSPAIQTDLMTPVPIALPTDTPDAIHEFENLMTPPSTEMPIEATTTVTNTQ